MLRAKLKSTSEEVRGRVAWNLGEMKAREAIPDLRSSFKNDPDAGVRIDVVLALGEMKAREAIPDLRKSLDPKDRMYEPEEWVRRNVVLALGMMGVKA